MRTGATAKLLPVKKNQYAWVKIDFILLIVVSGSMNVKQKINFLTKQA